MHAYLTTMETDLALGLPQRWPTRPPHDMRRAGELLRVLASICSMAPIPAVRTEALKGTVHILPNRLKAGHERDAMKAR